MGFIAPTREELRTGRVRGREAEMFILRLMMIVLLLSLVWIAAAKLHLT